MDNLHTIYYVLMFAGILLICIEIFVPGAVLGTMGGIALVAAIIMSFFIFSPQTALLLAIGIVLLLMIGVVLWLKFFPKSGVGRAMTLESDGRDFKAPGSIAGLIGREGEAVSQLRPAGFAVIDGRRTDVVTEGEMISNGEKVRVVKVEGSRVVVRRVSA